MLRLLNELAKGESCSPVTFKKQNSCLSLAVWSSIVEQLRNQHFLFLLFPYRQGTLLRKEFTMTTEDAQLSSMALRNDPYKRYSLGMKNKNCSYFHSNLSEANSEVYCYSEILIALEHHISVMAQFPREFKNRFTPKYPTPKIKIKICSEKNNLFYRCLSTQVVRELVMRTRLFSSKYS